MPRGTRRAKGKAGRSRKSSTAGRGRRALGAAALARLRRQLFAAVPEHPDQLSGERLAILRQTLYQRTPKSPPAR
jgi:hypothetical protein